MDQSAEAIAANLKNMRESRGLSLDRLASLTGVSKSMLRQIETGKSSPTIATMWKHRKWAAGVLHDLVKKPGDTGER